MTLRAIQHNPLFPYYWQYPPRGAQARVTQPHIILHLRSNVKSERVMNSIKIGNANEHHESIRCLLVFSVWQHAHPQPCRPKGRKLHTLDRAALGCIAVDGRDRHGLRRRRVLWIHRPARQLACLSGDDYGGRRAAGEGVLAWRANLPKSPALGVDHGAVRKVQILGAGATATATWGKQQLVRPMRCAFDLHIV
eukprot:SAG31_NODE_7622_length_1637_cov_1.204161_1_plen_193_part_01